MVYMLVRGSWSQRIMVSNLEEAMGMAYEDMAEGENDMTIHNPEGDIVARSRWYEGEPDEETQDSFVCRTHHVGYYDAWEIYE